MKIALGQINTMAGDIAGNVAKIKHAISVAKAENADLIVFPEQAIGGYPPEDLVYDDDFIRGNAAALLEIQRELGDLVAVVGYVEQQDGKLYNTAGLLSSAGLLAQHRKVCLPNYGVFDEQRYFASGAEVAVTALAGAVVGLTICEDLWYHPGPAQQQLALGANLLVNISASPYEIGKAAQRTELARRAVRGTRAALVCVNQVGGQDELVFDGGSQIVAPSGKVLAECDRFREQILCCEVDIADYVTAPKSQSQPVERKLFARAELTCETELENVEAEVYAALKLGTHDYFRKCGIDKAIVAVSGGIDSALTAAIAVDALGADSVICVYMPSRYSSEASRVNAKKLAENLGVQLLEIPIDGLHTAFAQQIQQEANSAVTGVTDENIQARTRGVIVMALANMYDALVLTTSNKSEIAVGYATLYGDTAGGFAVLKDVYKTLVYKLSKWRNAQSESEVIPLGSITAVPSAELRPEQTDQDSLPSYGELDKILQQYIDFHQTPAADCVSSNKLSAKEITELVDRAEYKRRLMPPGIKLTKTAFGRDRRMPVAVRRTYRRF